MIFFDSRLSVLWAIILLAAVAGFSGNGFCEFYEYINEDGVKCWTDDLSKIPRTKGRTAVVHKEKYDGLTEEDRQLMIEKEKMEAEAQQEKTQAAIEAYRKKQELEKEKERIRNQYTRVAIAFNRIMVPVTFRYDGNELTVPMILDTGASMTALHQSVAGQLRLPKGQKGYARVAGGKLLSTRSVTIDTISVGPKKWKNPTIMVLPESGPRQGYAGLLGQDFLGRYPYTIDYDKSAIRWTQ